MDILAAGWIVAMAIFFGCYLIFIVPVPTIITIVTLTILAISTKRTNHDNSKK